MTLRLTYLIKFYIADDQQVYFLMSPKKLKKSLIDPKVYHFDIIIFFGTITLVDRLSSFKQPGVDTGNGTIILFIEEVKSLGVLLDSELTWESQISSVEKKVNLVLYTLRFI